MATLAFLTIINFALGAITMYAVQAVLRKWTEAEARPVADPTPVAPAPPRAAQHHTKWLSDIMEKVDGDINRHSFEVDEISEALGGAAHPDADSILSAAAAMLVANRRLQADLAVAQQEIQQQRERVDALAAESRTDTLTGLANRRAFDEEMGRRLDQWRRHRIPVSLLMIDIDCFKQINDRYGHPVGDLALKWVAGIHARAPRQMDLVCRYGGEEFSVILPGTKLADAANVAERLRATIASKNFTHGEHEFPITVSVGVSFTIQGDNSESLVKRADEALYAAKQNGRNSAYLHNGNQVKAIEVDQGLVRHPYETEQLVAEYHGGTEIPAPTQFSSVRSSDISAKGISFICTSKPDCKAYVVRLGNGDQTRYMVANVANITPLSKQEPIQYRVGCAFVARLEPETEADHGGVPSAKRELVAC
jgi:diguanylate cyclase (GGDEF)-like protein